MRELRYAWRQLRRAPLFTSIAVITLALGIGANTAIFTLIQGILLRTLPVASPSQLYRIGDTDDCCVNGGFVGDHGDFDIFSYALYKQFQQSAPEFESLAAVQAGEARWGVRRGATMAASLYGEYVSGNYFSTLGVRAFAGRLLEPSDDQPGNAAVAVLSYSGWQNDFGADRSVVGATISVQAKPFVVVGIAPPGFFGDRVRATPPDLYVPLAAQLVWQPDAAMSLLNLPDAHWLYPIGRVRSGTSIPALQAKLSTVLRTWLSGRATYTANGGAAIIPRQHVVVVPAGGGIQSLQQQSGAYLKLLMILAGVVLLIACANLANMMLARSTSRRGEVALRMALGESRGRLLRRTLTESILLAALGGLAGLVVAYEGARAILALAFPRSVNSPIAAAPTLTVLGFAFLISLVTGVVFGLAPAWVASHAQPAEALRGANRSTRDRSSLSQNVLVIFQVALAMVLVVGALLTARSLGNLQDQNFGVAAGGRFVLHFDPRGAGYTEDRLPALYRQIEDRFGSLPGVAHVALAMYSPLEGDNWGECVIQEGHPAPGPNSRCGSSWDRVSPGFLDAIGVPIVQGRGITAQDTATSQPVAIVNEAFAKRFFPGQNPVGQHFGIDQVRNSGSWEIVGVFRDFKLNNPRRSVNPVYLRPATQIYTGYQQPGMISTENNSLFMDALIVDFDHVPATPDVVLRRTLAGIDTNLIVSDLRSFQAQIAGNFNADRLQAGLAGLFGALALILAAVGLYGVTAYLVARRTREIGVRMALGASRTGVVGLVLRGVAGRTALGLAVGIPAAIVAARLMASQMYGIGNYDPRSLALAAIILAACALAAGLIPARRAAAVDPIQTLKAE